LRESGTRRKVREKAESDCALGKEKKEKRIRWLGFLS